METQVRTPQMVFMHPQRLVVPLFQRRYVWNEENQWEPLWNDVVRIAERLLKYPRENQHPHFLGAVVLQQSQNAVGTMQERTIIDGQQRLTTLQLFFDALHAELVAANATTPAARLEQLVVNAQPFCVVPEDRFKVWPTNQDRAAFNAVMAATPPIDYDALGHSGERMIEAHRYFSQQVRNWLNCDGPDSTQTKAVAIESAVRDLLQMVVIDLGAEENAQEIFETLNARGAQLTAADLIKNFIFRRLAESDADVESAYQRYWKEFESAFWEEEITVGRLRHPRSALFLNHWLVSRTGEEIVAREVFTRFKQHALSVETPMKTLLHQIDDAARVYRAFVEGDTKASAAIDQLGLFAYRTSVLESEVVKPLVLYLLDPAMPAVPVEQIRKALSVVESWMVRRMLTRATTKNYNLVIAEVVTILRSNNRDCAGDCLEQFFASQTSSSRYWPDDDELREELRVLPAYRRLARGRMRMVLEAVEDHMRGWHGEKVGMGGERVARGKLAIEHIMPQKWEAHWPLLDRSRGDGERAALIHTIGNLTLLTSKLNTRVSNGPWFGENGKRHGLESHDVLLLNRELLKASGGEWSESAIRARTDELVRRIIEIWPAPQGHRSSITKEKVRPRHRVDLMDLISAGRLAGGTKLIPARKDLANQIATLLPDGRIDVGGTVFAAPSEAARSIAGVPRSGWSFFLVQLSPRKDLRDVRLEYLESLSVDGDDDLGIDDADSDDV